MERLFLFWYTFKEDTYISWVVPQFDSLSDFDFAPCYIISIQYISSIYYYFVSVSYHAPDT